MRQLLGACALALLLGWTACGLAQDETPALPDEQPAIDTEQPAVPTDVPHSEPGSAPQKPGGVQKARTGTTVIGEQESPLGLYIMPWRQSQAQAGLDRPARLLDEALLPLDPEVFKRQVEYHRALSEHLEKTGRATP